MAGEGSVFAKFLEANRGGWCRDAGSRRFQTCVADVWFPRGIIVPPQLCGGIPRSQMPQKVVKKTSALIVWVIPSAITRNIIVTLKWLSQEAFEDNEMWVGHVVFQKHKSDKIKNISTLFRNINHRKCHYCGSFMETFNRWLLSLVNNWGLINSLGPFVGVEEVWR